MEEARAGNDQSVEIKRRSFIAAAVTAALPVAVFSQNRDYGQNAPPIRYPDPDVVVLDNRFAKYKVGNASIQRLYTGLRWAEGPAWSGVGGVQEYVSGGFNTSCAGTLATSALRRSAGSSCTTPPGTREALTGPRYRP